MHTYGVSGTGVSALGDGRNAGLLGVGVRTDVRLPRTYEWYVMSEALVSTELLLTPEPADPEKAGKNRPAERLGVGVGWMRAPRQGHPLGTRVGFRADFWHGSLGDSKAAWAFGPGFEVAPLIFQLSALPPPWRSDETVTTGFVLVPSFMAEPIVRLDRDADSRFAIAYSATLSFGLQVSSSLVP